MRCRDFREIADSYLSDELLVETNHDVIRHLESCAECRRELTARRELRAKLRAAFENAPDLQPDVDFAGRLAAHLQGAELARPRFSAGGVLTLAIAASLVISAAFGLMLVYQRWSLNKSVVANAVLNQSAAGDHRDCALNHRLNELPIDLNEAGRKYDPVYIDLVRAVMSGENLPDGVELVADHSCVFKGRRFGHVILKYHSELVSVLVTQTESRSQVPDGGDFTTAQTDGYELAHFNTGQHAVYVVSGLSEAENMAIAQAIAPSLSRHIKDAKRIA